MNPSIFAMLVLEAQRLREESYIPKESLPPQLRDSLRSEHMSYKLDHRQAAELACEQQQWDRKWAEPIYLLNLLAWNDIQDWAEALS